MDMRKGIMVVALCYGLMGTHGFAFSANGAVNGEPVSKRPILSRLLRARSFIQELNLTGGQKDHVRDVLAKNREQLLQIVRNRLQARIELRGINPDSSANYANAQIQAGQMKERILEQIKPILNEAQLSLLLKRQQEREQRLRRILAQLDTQHGS